MSKKAWTAVVVLGIAVGWYALRGDSRSDAIDAAGVPEELVNRVWIDALPTSAKQKVEVFLMLGEPQVGQFLHTSAYEGDYSVFEWHERDGKRVEIVVLQTEKKHRVGFAVATSGCEPFDYCLKVKGAPRGAKRYYSMKDWVIEPGSRFELGDVQAFLRAHGARSAAR